MFTHDRELEIVNAILRGMGEAPVSSVDDLELVDAAMAVDMLHEVNREIQSRGWYWNTDRQTFLEPGTDGQIRVPKDTLKFTPSPEYHTKRLVLRGNRVYDAQHQTYQFSEGIRADLVVLLPISDVPESAAHYIKVRAGRLLQEQLLGSQTLSMFTRTDEATALSAMENEEAEVANFSMADSWDVFRIINRDTFI